MTQSATTPGADDALRVVPAEVAGATRAMFLASTSAMPMLRGPMVAYAPEDDGGADAGGDAGEGEAVEASDDQADADDDVDQVELDEDGNPVETEPAEDFDEVEYGDGKKYKVPRELNRGFLREADYTQKTQALAKEREAFAVERTRFTEANQALRSEIGKVHALEERIGQFQAVPWDQLRAASPDEWRELRDEYVATRDQLTEAKASLTKKEGEIAEAERQADATRIAETEAALADPKTGIPGWGPQVFQDLVSFAGTHGYSPADLRIASTSDWKLLHLASIGAKAQQQQQRVAQHKKTQETRPAAPTKGTGAVRDLNSVKSTDEWMRRRNAQVAKRA